MRAPDKLRYDDFQRAVQFDQIKILVSILCMSVSNYVGPSGHSEVRCSVYTVAEEFEKRSESIGECVRFTGRRVR